MSETKGMMQTTESNPCGYCHRDENGDIEMDYFYHPEKPGHGILISAFDGKLTVKVDYPAELSDIVACGINYCPYCGREYDKKSPRP